MVLEGELKHVVAEREKSVADIEHPVEEHNTNQVSDEIFKAANYQQKQEIARLPEELKLTKISVEDLQVEEKTMS